MKLCHLFGSRIALGEAQAVKLGPVGSETVVEGERVHEVVHAHDMACGEFHDSPIGG